MSGYGVCLSNASYAASARAIGNVDPSFQTSCIETSENADSALVVGTAAVRGSTSSFDPISKGTAWLYSQFAQGLLATHFDLPPSAGLPVLQRARP